MKHDEQTLTCAEEHRLGTVFRRNDSLFVSRQILDDFLLVPICRKASEVAHIYRLNEIGSVFWKNIDGQRNLGRICSLIHDRYEVDITVVQRDLLELSQQLEHIGALEEAADAEASPS